MRIATDIGVLLRDRQGRESDVHVLRQNFSRHSKTRSQDFLLKQIN